jgi:hypothetical protein
VSGTAVPDIPSPQLHAVLERVHERIPRGGDQVLVHTDRAPYPLPVRRIDEDPRDGIRALGLIQYSHLKFVERDVVQMRVDLADRIT